MAKIDQNTTGLQNILDLINNLPTDGGGSEITDGTGATANDIANGKTAYVNGEKITGKVSSVNSGSSEMLVDSTPSVNGSNLRLNAQYSNDKLMRSGSWSIIDTPLSNFGNAATSDVVVDKTFTSSNGLVLTGNNPYKKTETNNEVNTQKDLISQIQTALANKTAGGSGSSLDTSDANVTEAVLFKNYIAYGANDRRVVGSFTLDSEINSQNSLLTQIQSALQNKSSASGTKETWTFTMENGSTVTKEVYV